MGIRRKVVLGAHEINWAALILSGFLLDYLTPNMVCSFCTHIYSSDCISHIHCKDHPKDKFLLCSVHKLPKQLMWLQVLCFISHSLGGYLFNPK